MNAVDIEKLYISQLCYAHIVENKDGNEMFVNVYSDKFILSMFEGGEPVVVEVRRVNNQEESRYWAWQKNFSEKPYMFIWPSKEKTLQCVPNYVQRTKDKEGRIVNVVVERWSKL